MTLKVGDTIWRFDANHRVYKKEGGRSQGPNYRDHWRPMVIASETSRSWITKWGEKCPKKGQRWGWALTEGEVDDDVYVHDNRWRIIRRIENIRDAETLRRIEAQLPPETP